jgi:hypothetical protein
MFAHQMKLPKWSRELLGVYIAAAASAAVPTTTTTTTINNID